MRVVFLHKYKERGTAVMDNADSHSRSYSDETWDISREAAARCCRSLFLRVIYVPNAIV